MHLPWYAQRTKTYFLKQYFFRAAKFYPIPKLQNNVEKGFEFKFLLYLTYWEVWREINV